MGLIRSSYIRNPNKTTTVVAAQISSFTPNIPKTLVKEADDETLTIEGNDQAALDAEITNPMDVEEIDNPVDLQLEFENPTSTSHLRTTPLTLDDSPFPSPSPPLDPGSHHNPEPPSSPPLEA